MRRLTNYCMNYSLEKQCPRNEYHHGCRGFKEKKEELPLMRKDGQHISIDNKYGSNPACTPISKKFIIHVSKWHVSVCAFIMYEAFVYSLNTCAVLGSMLNQHH